jgi:ELWxxDGT repeat protein
MARTGLGWTAAVLLLLWTTASGPPAAAAGAARRASANGTASGTGSVRLVHDFYPGERRGGPPPKALQPLGGTLFFIAEDRDRHSSVWRSDGNPEGASPLALEEGGAVPGDPGLLVRVGERMVWSGVSSSDDAPALYAARAAGGALRLPVHQVVAGASIVRERLYFLDCAAALCALWSTDGTAPGTAAVPGAGEPLPAADVAVLGVFADRWVVLRRRSAVVAWDVERGRLDTLLGARGRHAVAYPLADALVLVTRDKLWRVWASRPGAGSSEQVFQARQLDVAGATDERLYFVAGFTSYGESGALWSTDGSRAGTRRYSGFSPEAYSFFADRLGTLGSTTFLPMAGYYTGALLAADEEAAELRELQHVCSGKYGCMSTYQSNVTVAGDLGYHTINGKLFQTDGTPEGTRPHDLLAAATPASLRASGDVLVLGASSPEGETGLWETDGRSTRLLSPSEPGRQLRVSGRPEPFGGGWAVPGALLGESTPSPEGHFDEGSPSGPQLWQVATGELTPLTALRHVGAGIAPYWAAVAGERRLIVSGGLFGVGGGGPPERLPTYPATTCSPDCPTRELELGGRLLFVGGSRLWASDGTAAGTVRLPATPASGLPFVVGLGPLGENEALAVLGDGWLWRTDGTPAGTTAIARLPAASGGTSVVGPPVALGDAALFFRRVPVTYSPSNGVLELWRTDGTAAGTLRLADVPFDANTALATAAVTVGGRLFFRLGGVLWTSDGSEAGTFALPEQLPGGTFGLAAGSNVLFAGAGYLAGYEGPQTLWAIDPHTFQARQIAAFSILGSGTAGSRLGSAVGDALLFSAIESTTTEWWVSEGTAESTGRLPSEVRVGARQLPVVAGARRYFRACDADYGCELWSLDATGGDRRLEADLWPGPRDGLREILWADGDTLLFAGTEPEVGDELWELRP